MRIGVVTLFPEMLAALREFGVSGRALSKGIASLSCWNPRDYSSDRHRSVDDRPYGGGPGMVMLAVPLLQAIRAARAALGPGTRCVYLSPQGRRLDQDLVRELARESRLLLVSGRYEGIDERVAELEVDDEVSLGDFVLSGGEIGAMALIDAVLRLQPGALGDAESAQQDSFMDGLLDCPHYTRPEVVEGQRVPEVLLSGDHEKIRRWRLRQALGRTWQRRTDLLERRGLSDTEQGLLDEFIREQGCAKSRIVD